MPHRRSLSGRAPRKQRQHWNLVTGPTALPFTVNEAREYLRIDQDQEAGLVQSLTKAAVRAVEQYLGGFLMPQTWDIWLDNFPFQTKGVGRGGRDIWFDGVIQAPTWLVDGGNDAIVLNKFPLDSVTSITTHALDNTATLVSVAVFRVDNFRTPPAIVVNDGQVWPQSGLRNESAVQVKAVMGYADKTKIPDDLTQAVKLTLAHFYENRDDKPTQMPEGAKALIDLYRIQPL